MVEESSCCGIVELSQVPEYLNELSTLSSLLKADDIEVLESLALAVIPDFCNHLGSFLVYFLYFNYVSL